MTSIANILGLIDSGNYAIPVFQRGYVWNRDQVKKLMNSLYNGYPIGILLVWNTTTDPTIARGEGELVPGNVNMILDGQQRITSLYGIIRGKAPKFFEGNSNSFTGLYFNVEEEIFEFYTPAKMKNNPLWFSVTDVMQKDAWSCVSEKKATSDIENPDAYTNLCMPKLQKLANIKDRELHIEIVSGPDKTIDVVVEIFNQVNSGGTKLSKGDLALAKICSEWPEAREQMKNILLRYQNSGYDFSMDWLLRCLTVYMTGQPYFNVLSKISIQEVKEALPNVDKMIGTCLDHIGTRLGLDHSRVLGGVFAIATMIGYLRYNNWKLSDSKEWDKLLYWYVHSFLLGRYAGSTESVLARDLKCISDGLGIEGLLNLLKLSRGNLTVRPEDFWGWSTGARFYPLLYLLTRTNHARDWSSNLELSNNLLGKNSTLDVHHIFPKDVLYKAGKSKSIVNSLANYAFLTKDTNLEISNKFPTDYIPVYNTKCPGALESHWIPMDPELWKVENYEEFLAQRRILLAEAANNLLDSLYQGKLASKDVQSFSTKEFKNDTENSNEEAEIEEISHWMIEQGLYEGCSNFELINPTTGAVEAIIDLAWPDGIQYGLSEPIALLLNETAETQAIVSKYGYKYYTSGDELKEFIKSTYLK